MARPRIKIDPAEVERLAARGLSLTQICDALGFSIDTLARRRKDTEAIAKALRKGRGQGVDEIASALFEQAKKGNVRAQIFFLKARAGWSETQSRPYAVDPFRDLGSPGHEKEISKLNLRITAFLNRELERAQG